MVLAILFGMISGGLIVEQQHFSACQKQGFEGEICKTEKKICLITKDETSCSKQ